MKKAYFLMMGVVLGLGLAACDDDDPVPPQQPGEVTWNRISTELTPEDMSLEDCDAPLRFEVRSDGTYSAGPCKNVEGATPATGTLEADEKTRLSELATPYSKSDLSTRQCDALVEQPGNGKAVLGYTSGATQDIFTVNGTEGCYLGDFDQVTALISYVDELADRYYPTAPEPQPSPSASPTPGPSPTPSPTATALPAPARN